jgi:septum formation protein
MTADLRLLLASASPRRRVLIGLLGLPVAATAADVDESPRPAELPQALATRLAREKAETCAGGVTGAVVVAADSVVVLDGQPLGKPADEDDARAMLRGLSGRAHRVLTGVALLDTSTGHWHEGLVCTDVHMRPYADHEIEAYVRGGSPMDKAGAYGIQDAEFSPVSHLGGCYLNVVGLPLCEVVRGLGALGYSHPARGEIGRDPPCGLCRRGASALQHGVSLNSFFPAG